MSGSIKITCTSPEETDSLAKLLSTQVYAGLVIALNGDLGAGKTTFVRSLIKNSGIDEIVPSPTFTLLNIHGSKPKFYHFDLYRLNSLEDIENIGGEELIPPPDGIALIEWADRIPEILPDKYLQINISIIDDNSRLFELTSHGTELDLGRIHQQWQF